MLFRCPPFSCRSVTALCLFPAVLFANPSVGTTSFSYSSNPAFADGTGTSTVTAGNAELTFDLPSTSEVIIDDQAPSITAITLEGDPQPDANEITYKVVFSEPVENVNMSDFELKLVSGFAAGLITQAIENATQTEVLVRATIEGNLYGEHESQLRLSLSADLNDIADSSGNPLASFDETTIPTFTSKLNAESTRGLMNFVWETEDIPSQSPLQLNSGSMALLFPGLAQIYGNTQPVKAEFSIDLLGLNRGFLSNERPIWSNLPYTVMISVLDEGNYVEAVELSGTLSMSGGLKAHAETDDFSYSVSTLNFDTLTIVNSNVGIINIATAVFRLNLMAISLIHVINESSWSRLCYPLPPIRINEVKYANDGSDSIEYIEFYDGGIGQSRSRKLTVTVGDGDGATSVQQLDLTTDADGYAVLGSSTVENVTDTSLDSVRLNGGPIVFSLNQGDPDITGSVTVEEIASLWHADLGPSFSQQRIPEDNAVRGDTTQFFFGSSTPGSPNSVFRHNPNQTLAENTSFTLDLDAFPTSKDMWDENVTYAITGGADRALFSIETETGDLSLLSARDFEEPADHDSDNVYVVEVTASHTTSSQVTDTQTISLTITDVDDTPPSAPPAPNLSASTDTGSSDSDNLTKNTTPTFTGTAEAGSTVTLFVDHNSNDAFDNGTDTVVATGSATDGNYSLAPSEALAEGTLVIKAIATDAHDNVSAASPALTVIIDTTAPVITSGAAISVTYGATPSYTITATGDPTSFGASSLPAGLNVSPSSGIISGNAPGDAIGQTVVTVNADDDAGNQDTLDLTLTVTPRSVTISGLVGVNKNYDGTSSASVSGEIKLSGVLSSDDITIESTTATTLFADKTVGVGKAITATGYTLSGTASGFYTLSQPSDLTANITARGITLTGLVAENKVYDGTTTAVIDSSGLSLVGIQGDDTVTLDQSGATANFDDKLIGTAKSVTFGGATLTGADAGNYTLTAPTDLSADITAANFTMVGATVINRPYDGNTTAVLDFSGASLSGVSSSDIVTFDSSGATGAYASADAGTDIAVTVSGVALTGTDAGNYTLTQPTLTGDINKVTATVIFADLSQVYTGSALAPTVTTKPSGLTVALTYDGDSTGPINTGSYTVEATIVDTNYQGVDNDTFVIEKADQTVTIAAVGTLTAGTATELSATASSGLTPVTFTLDSGSATLSGTTLTPTATDPITITANQAGDANYHAASASLTITSIAKPSQTITFGALADKQANSGAFDLSATASSGLNVTFTLVSGPAMLSGNTITMTGATGIVNVRADQAGNSIWAAASPVTQTFEVTQAGPLIYFGTTNEGVEFAAEIPEGQTTGTLMGSITSTGQFYILSFQINEDRSITALDLQVLGEPVTAATSLAQRSLRRIVAESTERTTAADLAYTFTGTIQAGVLNFSIAELGVTLTATVEPANGPTATIAGLYEANSLNSANGSTSSIVGTTGKVYTLAVTPNIIAGGSSTITSDGVFTLTTDQNVTILGNVDAPTTTVTGTIILPDGEEDSFAGLSTDTLRTDRLINLSTRAHVDAAAGGALVTGFVIGGDTSKRVLLRAIGPGLRELGLTTALADPQLTIYNAAREVIAEVDNWGGDAATTETMSRVGAFPIAADSLDAVYTTDLAPGSYTMRVTNNGDTGVAIAEIYDASENPNSEYQRLINISSRGRVIGGEGVLVGGFIVTGNSPKRVLVRGVGPGLAEHGLSSLLNDPLLTIYNVQKQVIASNEDWETPTPVEAGQRTANAAEIAAANKQLGAFPLAAGSQDAALIITLQPGSYTVELSASNAGEQGNALIEIYEIPE